MRTPKKIYLVLSRKTNEGLHIDLFTSKQHAQVEMRERNALPPVSSHCDWRVVSYTQDKESS